ncbi:Monoacylglycerol lipase [Paraconexibacter sp. AEG42_29]|uniref:Monoacylglycerol lipase n=1 Tax=Paraconexibacter sp. AEG42_29 TaxID=2997339 RepID=A0AAU7AYN9_9ACTN
MTPTVDVLQGSHGDYHVHVWDDSDARYIALLAHGIAEHARRYDHVAAALVADGAAVYAPDHYGHGLSAGERGLVEDVEAYVDDLHLAAELARGSHPGLPVVLIGHSLGGIIATRFAQRYMDELTALVLSAPVIGGNPGFEALLAMDPLPEVPLDPAALSRDASVGEAYAADDLVYHGPLARKTLETIFGAVDTIAQGPKLDLPTLWLHGDQDPLAPYPVTAEAVERLRTDKVSEKAYAGAMHEIFNETNKDEVIGDAVAFLHAQTT